MEPRRIPISQGFYIQFSQTGRAVCRGLKEEQVVSAVVHWLAISGSNHPDTELVLQWLEQWRKQLAEDAELQRTREARQSVNDMLDKAARAMHLDPKVREVLRPEILKHKGIPPEDD